MFQMKEMQLSDQPRYEMGMKFLNCGPKSTTSTNFPKISFLASQEI
jgi:hypothetical protein